MKRNTLTTLGMLLSMTGAGMSFAADITVEILALPNTKGMVMVSLFDRAMGFPSAVSYGQQIAASRQVAGQPLRVVFTDVPAGRYAIAAFHDEDGNGKLTTNIMGIPTEVMDFSNKAKASFGSPSFDSAAIEVGAQGATVKLQLQ